MALNIGASNPVVEQTSKSPEISSSQLKQTTVDVSEEIEREIESSKIELQDLQKPTFAIDDPVRRFQQEQGRMEVQNLGQNIDRYSVEYFLTPSAVSGDSGTLSSGTYKTQVQYTLRDD